MRPHPGGALALIAALGLAGCMVGPSYQADPVVPQGTQVGGAREPDTTRGFFDSLTAARAADSAAGGARAVALSPMTVMPAGAPELAWRDILQDSILTQLVATALRQNRDLALAQERILEYQARVGVVKGPLLPSISANASVSTNRAVVLNSPSIEYNALTVTGDLAWELDFWGKLRRGVQAANADLGAQDAAERATVLTLVSDVASGYLQLLELDQERAISAQTLAASQATLELARQRYAQGLVSELDVRQFEAQVAVPAARLAQVDRLRAAQENDLSVLLGQTPGPISRGGSLADAARAVTVPDSLPGELLTRRPDVEQAERAYAAATARIGVADAARLPTIAIIGSYGTQSATNWRLLDSHQQIYQLLAGVSIPLFTGGTLENTTRVARAQADQARLAYESSVLNAWREASNALAAVRTTNDEVAAQATQVGALRRARELAELRYDSGVSSYLEVLDAQRNLFTAELALSQAQLGQLTSAVELFKALGGSWAN